MEHNNTRGLDTMRDVIREYMTRHPNDDPTTVDWEKARAAYRERRRYHANRDRIREMRRRAGNTIAAAILEEMRTSGSAVDPDERGAGE